jgi:hypothetical protein
MTGDQAQLAADELEIRNLVARLAHMADMGDLEKEYLPLFTEDAEWQFPGSADSNAEPAVVAGHDAILADRIKRRTSGFQGPGTNTRHVNTMFVGESNTGAPQIRGIGHYHDIFRRTPDGWKLARRTITPG